MALCLVLCFYSICFVLGYGDLIKVIMDLEQGEMKVIIDTDSFNSHLNRFIREYRLS